MNFPSHIALPPVPNLEALIAEWRPRARHTPEEDKQDTFRRLRSEAESVLQHALLEDHLEAHMTALWNDNLSSVLSVPAAGRLVAELSNAQLMVAYHGCAQSSEVRGFGWKDFPTTDGCVLWVPSKELLAFRWRDCPPPDEDKRIELDFRVLVEGPDLPAGEWRKAWLGLRLRGYTGMRAASELNKLFRLHRLALKELSSPGSAGVKFHRKLHGVSSAGAECVVLLERLASRLPLRNLAREVRLIHVPFTAANLEVLRQAYEFPLQEWDEEVVPGITKPLALFAVRPVFDAVLHTGMLPESHTLRWQSADEESDTRVFTSDGARTLLQWEAEDVVDRSERDPFEVNTKNARLLVHDLCGSCRELKGKNEEWAEIARLGRKLWR